MGVGAGLFFLVFFWLFFFFILFAWEKKIGWDCAVNSFSIPHQLLCFLSISITLLCLGRKHLRKKKAGFNTPKSICLGINQNSEKNDLKRFPSLKSASCFWGPRHLAMSF